MKRALALTFAVMVGVAPSALTRAHASNVARYPAVVRCAHASEDSLAHVRMVKYDPATHTLVYVCKRTGY